LTLGGGTATLDWMTRRALLTLVIVAALGPVAGGDRAAAYLSSTWYEGADGWAQARRQQRAHDVPILVYFRADWCPHCHALDEMLEERDVQRRLRQVIKVRIDPEDGEEEEELFSEEFGAQGFPALFLVSRSGARRQVSSGSSERLLSQLPSGD
jgi:thiol:disulfide interchange protein